MITEKLSADIRVPYVNSISNPLALISTSNSPGQKHENSLRKPKRKVGKTMSTNFVPLPKRTQSGGWLGKSLEYLNQSLSNTLQETKRKQLQEKTLAVVLGEKFSENSSLKNSNSQFISYKSKSEKQRLNFKTNNPEKYNLPIATAELKEAI